MELGGVGGPFCNTGLPELLMVASMTAGAAPAPPACVMGRQSSERKKAHAGAAVRWIPSVAQRGIGGRGGADHSEGNAGVAGRPSSERKEAHTPPVRQPS